MKAPIGVARVAAARAVMDVTEEVLRPFTLAFEDRIAAESSVEVPLTLDGLTVRTPLRDGADLHRVGVLLERAGLAERAFDKLVEVASRALTTEGRRVELAVTAHRRNGLTAVRLRLSGGWSFVELYDRLREVGVSHAAVRRWDDVSGTLLTGRAALLDVGFDRGGLNASVHVEQQVPPSEVSRWTGQLDHVLDRLGLPICQRAWMRTLHPALCRRTINSFLWTICVRRDDVPAEFGLTLPRIPMSIVLKHGLDLHPDVDSLGMRLGALMGSFERQDDEVARWGIRLRGERPSTWIAVAG